MSPKPNCFQIQGDQIIPGIPLYSTVLEQRVPIEYSDSLKTERSFYGLPRFGNFSREASVEAFQSLAELAASHRIIYFESPELDFGGRTFLEGLNLWPGGEWHTKRPLWRRAKQEEYPRQRRMLLYKAEMWALENHEQLLLVDRYGAVRILRFRFGNSVLYEPSISEVAEYICQRGEVAKTYRAAEWALVNLELIAKSCEIDLKHHLTVVKERLQKMA